MALPLSSGTRKMTAAAFEAFSQFFVSQKNEIFFVSLRRFDLKKLLLAFLATQLCLSDHQPKSIKLYVTQLGLSYAMLLVMITNLLVLANSGKSDLGLRT